MEKMHIRELSEHDWNALVSIYESGIATGYATFETSAPEWDDWDEAHLEFGRLVAVIDQQVVGWAALSPVSSRCVYGGVAEVSIYIHEEFRGKRIGQQLLGALIITSEQHGIWTLQAGIFRENIASIKLHESVGFRIIGYRERIGKLNGQWRDNVIMEKRSTAVGLD